MKKQGFRSSGYMYLSVTMWLYFLLKLFLVLNGRSSFNVNCIVMLKKKNLLRLRSATKLYWHFVQMWYLQRTKQSTNRSLHSKLGCLLFSTGSSNSSTTLDGGDGEGKALFFPFQTGKMSERPLHKFCQANSNGFNKKIYIFPLIEHISVNSFENLLLNLQKQGKLTG